MKRTFSVLIAMVCVSMVATAQTQIALKSARETSTYYAFAVGIAKALMEGVPGVKITVETSAGSVENVKLSRTRNEYLFTSPPSLVKAALGGGEPFKEGGYGRVRSLWPIPGIVMHWVVRQDSGVQNLSDLVGKKFVPGGAGSAGERITRDVLAAMGIVDRVDLVRLDLSEGVQAVRNKRAVGFATSSTPPASMIQEIAATVPIRLLELSDQDYERVKAKYARAVIPAGMYSGVDTAVKTISEPVALYTVDNLSVDMAYKLTKTFWESRSQWESVHPAMKLISMDDVNFMVAKLHPGALRYYREIGFKVPPSLE